MFVQYRNSITCLWVKEMHINCPNHQRAESASPGSAHSTVIEVQKFAAFLCSGFGFRCWNATYSTSPQGSEVTAPKDTLRAECCPNPLQKEIFTHVLPTLSNFPRCTCWIQLFLVYGRTKGCRSQCDTSPLSSTSTDDVNPLTWLWATTLVRVLSMTDNWITLIMLCLC